MNHSAVVAEMRAEEFLLNLGTDIEDWVKMLNRGWGRIHDLRIISDGMHIIIEGKHFCNVVGHRP